MKLQDMTPIAVLMNIALDDKHYEIGGRKPTPQPKAVPSDYTSIGHGAPRDDGECLRKSRVQRLPRRLNSSCRGGAMSCQYSRLQEEFATMHRRRRAKDGYGVMP